MQFKQSESTAARRRFPLFLVDATDHVTPETGEAGGQPQISKNGGAWTNTTATLTAVGNGHYYVELTAAELDTVGMVSIRYKSANTIEFNASGQVVTLDPYTRVAAALEAIHLDHLFAVAATGAEVANNSLWAKLHDSESTADCSNYDHTERSLEAIGTYAQSLDEVDVPQLLARIPENFPEPTGVPAANASFVEKLSWLFALARNKITQSTSTQTLRNDADDANIGTSTHSDNGSEYTRSKWST
jgi:hypothetical protein